MKSASESFLKLQFDCPMNRRLLLTVVCWSFLNFHVSAADSPFRVVFIDEQTEDEYGPFPLSRSLLSKGIEQIKKRKAKGTILKFFLDVPKDAPGDLKLAESFSGIPVLLEARLDDSEPKPNVLPERCFLPDAVPENDKTISGQSGWIPLPVFSAKTQAIGFVDILRPEKLPILEMTGTRCTPRIGKRCVIGAGCEQLKGF